MKFEVGKRYVKRGCDTALWFEVKFVDEEVSYAKSSIGDPLIMFQKHAVLYEEMPRIKKLAPALVRDGVMITLRVSDQLYESEEEAKNDWRDQFVRWPARPNDWYEVEE